MIYRSEKLLGLSIVHTEDKEKLLEFVNRVYDLGKSGYPQYFIEEEVKDFDLGFNLEISVVGGECFKDLASEFVFSDGFRTEYNKFAAHIKNSIITKVLEEEVYNEEHFKTRGK